MLDILVIFLFSKQIGSWAEKKGYRRGLFRGLVIGAWFTGEILGIITAIAVFADSLSEDAVFILLLPTLLGAGVGIMTMVFVVMALPSRVRPAAAETAPVRAPVEAEPDRTPVAPWTCPHCGYHNTYRDDRCFNCKEKKG